MKNEPMSNTEFGAYLIALGMLMASKDFNLADAQEPREHSDKRALELNGRSMGISDARYAQVEQEARAQLAAIPAIQGVRGAVNGYYDELTARQHGQVALNQAMEKIQHVLGMTWKARKGEQQ